MIKHAIDKSVIFKGKVYNPNLGFVYLPERVDIYNPVEEEVKRDLNKEAEELGVEGDDLAKFKRKNKEAKIKYLEKLKEAK